MPRVDLDAVYDFWFGDTAGASNHAILGRQTTPEETAFLASTSMTP